MTRIMWKFRILRSFGVGRVVLVATPVLVVALLASGVAALFTGLGGRALPPLRSLLVTGDSSATVLDQDLAQRLLADGVHVFKDAQNGGSISKPLDVAPISWVKYSRQQAEEHPGGAVVMFLGANEGHSFDGVDCCDADWVAIFARMVGSIMDNYRGAGSRVYWLTLPAPRSRGRRKIAVAINKAVRAAAAVDPRPSEVTVVDIAPIITPKFTYHRTARIDEHRTIVREHDKQHLNDAGSNRAADEVLKALAEDFDIGSSSAASDGTH